MDKKLTLRIPEELYELAVGRAVRERRSLNSTLLLAIEVGLYPGEQPRIAAKALAAEDHFKPDPK